MANTVTKGTTATRKASRAASPASKRRGQKRRQKSAVALLKQQLSQRPLPLWAVIVADAAVLAVALIVFALFHHVLPRDETSVGLVSQKVSTGAYASAAAPTQAPAAPEAPPEESVGTEAETSTPEADPVGVFSHRYADKFTDGEVFYDSNGYRSKNINIAFTKHMEPGLVYYVADIYIRRIECLRSAFAKDKFGRGRWERITSISRRMNAILAINGDYYGGRSDGIVIRNGELYRNDKNPVRDICVLNWDGTMEIFHPRDWDTYRAMENGAYQGWNFGPSLLDESGNAIASFDSEVSRINPRTAIGYYEPGHYCFVVVDGRSNRSKGITLPDLSSLMKNLGCNKAYNFDGGQSSEMVVNHETISRPDKGGRSTSDAVLIIDE